MIKKSDLLLDRFYGNCRQFKKLCANIFNQPEVFVFISDKEKETSTTDGEILDRDACYSFPMGITDHSASSCSSSSNTNDEGKEFVKKCFKAPLSHQRVKQQTIGNMLSLGNSGQYTANYFGYQWSKPPVSGHNLYKFTLSWKWYLCWKHHLGHSCPRNHLSL